MLDRLLEKSMRQRAVVLLATAGLVVIGLWSAMPYGRYDTVTVRLIRREHFPAGFGPDRGEFTLAPLEESPHPLTAQPVWGSAEICAQVI